MSDEQKPSGELFKRINALEKDMASLDAGMQALKASVDGLSSTMAKRSENDKTNWAVVFGGLSVFVTIFILAFSPIYSGQTRQDSDIHDNEVMLSEIRSRLWSEISGSEINQSDNDRRLMALEVGMVEFYKMTGEIQKSKTQP